MDDPPPAPEDQLAPSGDPPVPADPAPPSPAVALAPAAAPPAPAQQPAPADRQPGIGIDATFEPPPGLAAAIDAAKGAQDTGLKAILELILPMDGACPRLAKILRSAAIRTSLESYERQDAELVRQQALLKREAFWSNLCLLAAGVISGLILAVSAGALVSLALGPLRR